MAWALDHMTHEEIDDYKIGCRLFIEWVRLHVVEVGAEISCDQVPAAGVAD
jgi:hypothetical protein